MEVPILLDSPQKLGIWKVSGKTTFILRKPSLWNFIRCDPIPPRYNASANNVCLALPVNQYHCILSYVTDLNLLSRGHNKYINILVNYNVFNSLYYYNYDYFITLETSHHVFISAFQHIYFFLAHFIFKFLIFLLSPWIIFSKIQQVLIFSLFE